MGAYKENLADGIQILRYELGQAYVAHHDYFPAQQSEDHSWNPYKGGSNRFATVFLYLSDVEVGVFCILYLILYTYYAKITAATDRLVGRLFSHRVLG